MQQTLISKAIEAAIKQDWYLAIEINLQILALAPTHIATLNRLGKAYKEVGQILKSRETFNQVLELDRYNSIAKKNLEAMADISDSDQAIRTIKVNTNFVEEPGKTKTLTLTRLGNPRVLSKLQPGQIVLLEIGKHAICVNTEEGNHIGALTDDIAFQLKKFLDAGNRYQVTIRSVSPKLVKIFVREIYRSDKLLHIPTFTQVGAGA